MLDIEEYKLDGHDRVLTEDDVISQGEVKWFRKELVRIAGENPHGKPNIQMVWGVTHEDPMAVDRGIKYLDFHPFGERRWILEIWRSPEFLVRSGRYKMLTDQGTVKDFYFCKGCHVELFIGAKGEPDRCAECGSNRHYLRQIREDGEGRILCDFPAEGCYDYWLRIERANLTYHPPDNEVLKIVGALWQWELMPQNQRDALEQADRERQRRQEIDEMRQPSGAIYTGAVPFTHIPR